VLDLSRNDTLLLPSQAYLDITDPADRLYVPAECVPLWEQRGWHGG
jgi:hypothetical protein